MATFERGFKAWAERTSASLRRELQLKSLDPLPMPGLATYLGVLLLTPHDVEGMPADLLNQLLKIDPEGWSAVTCNSAGVNTVIYNPKHAPPRQSSDISHELAHIVLDHDPAQIILSQTGEMCMRSFNEREEAEANWLAGAILLPREALLVALQHQTPEAEVCRTFAVSKKMLNWRYLVTGVGIQAQRSASRVRTQGS